MLHWSCVVLFDVVIFLFFFFMFFFFNVDSDMLFWYSKVEMGSRLPSFGDC